MDANGTQFHLFVGKPDWGRCFSSTGADGQQLKDTWGQGLCTVDYDTYREELRLRPRLFRFIAGPADRKTSIADRRGAARDRYGNWYWVDESQKAISVRSVGTNTTTRFWPAEALPTAVATAGAFQTQQASLEGSSAGAESPTLFGLAVTSEHFLIVGVSEPAGLLAFDLYAGGPPRQLAWPTAIPFEPYDIAAAPAGGVFVLDRRHQNLWALDRFLNVIPCQQGTVPLGQGQPELFQPVEATEPMRYSEGHQFAAGTSLALPLPMHDPIAVDALPDGTAIILDQSMPASPPSPAVLPSIYHYTLGSRLSGPLPVDVSPIIEFPDPATSVLTAQDLAVASVYDDAGQLAEARIYITTSEGNQAFAFSILRDDTGHERLVPFGSYYPMRLHTGKALVSYVADAYYDSRDQWFALAQQPKPRYVDWGELMTPPLDGKIPGCVWHRILLDGCIPVETSVVVYSRAADTSVELEMAEWVQEPSPYLRGDGSEIPHWGSAAKGSRIGTWDLLFQRARGRYLQLRLVLTGNGGRSPRIHALRVYYPRFSYAEQYLPGAYRQEPESASFIERFLANFEGMYTSIEDRIAAAQILFDTRACPGDGLDWLASWFGVVLDPAWSDERRRLFLRFTPYLFQRRGTVRGLELAVELALASCVRESLFSDDPDAIPTNVRIVERFRSRQLPGVMVGDPTDLLGLRVVEMGRRWKPAQGGALLFSHYVDVLHKLGIDAMPTAFPLAAPLDSAQASVWKDFVRVVLGFVPTTGLVEQSTWQKFLRRKYGRIAALNDAYGLGARHVAFEELVLPDRLPSDGNALLDWYSFHAAVLVMRDTAHRFDVLLPVTTQRVSTLDEPLRRKKVAERIVEVAKPAHTIFSVKFYWAALRLGAVRLGIDTVLDLGSRAAGLLEPAVVGESLVAASAVGGTAAETDGQRTTLTC